MERPNYLCIVSNLSVDARVRVSMGRASELKTTPDFTGPMWDIAHAPNSDTDTSGCATSYEKDDKMIRNQAKVSIRIDK
jgi:hypothetical protein